MTVVRIFYVGKIMWRLLKLSFFIRKKKNPQVPTPVTLSLPEGSSEHGVLWEGLERCLTVLYTMLPRSTITLGTLAFFWCYDPLGPAPSAVGTIWVAKLQ